MPTALRDRRWFMYLPMRLVLKGHVHDFLSFKASVFAMTPDELGDLYRRTGAVGSREGEVIEDLGDWCYEEEVAAAPAPLVTST
ncbi:hypothetical protein [Krasilnikovia sp. MM14-A1259]|uniref:hypothetical protein n=1 Tax=Krasilnikovia sp. MM14-A1259 TaxID=3373539 RepID=UPI00399D3C80